MQPFCRIPMAARMNNQYEERLGTERMLPLIFKMALPAVAAQFVNLLYNIVDRIYIGHIPEIGTNALAGVGVTTSIVILISSFSGYCGGWRCTAGCHGTGTRRPVRAGKFLGNGFMLLILFTVLTSLASYLFMELFCGLREHLPLHFPTQKIIFPCTCWVPCLWKSLPDSIRSSIHRAPKHCQCIPS